VGKFPSLQAGADALNALLCVLRCSLLLCGLHFSLQTAGKGRAWSELLGITYIKTRRCLKYF